MRPKPNRGKYIVFISVIGLAGLIAFNFANPIPRRADTQTPTLVAAHDYASIPPPSDTATQKPSIVFTCPDGRTGLHLVHSRFFVGQASATPLFIASRLSLLRTFLIPSLNLQSTKTFIFIASYDPNLRSSAIHAFKTAILTINAAHIIASEQTIPKDGGNPGGNWANLNFTDAIEHLSIMEPRVKDVDIFITSRIDSDDATHYDAIAAFQNYSCGGTSSRSTSSGSSSGSRRSIKGRKSGCPPVKLAYPQNGQLWFPSPKEDYGTAGIWKTGKDIDDLYRVMAIMQTLILTGK